MTLSNPYIAEIVALPEKERLAEAFATIRYLTPTDDDAVLAHLCETYGLTKSQAKVLYALHRSPEEIVDTDTLLSALYANPADEPLSDTIKVYVHYIRRAITDAPFEIKTVRGFGYRLEGAIPELKDAA